MTQPRHRAGLDVPTSLQAAKAPEHLTAAFGLLASQVDTDARTIPGILLEFDQVGYTSIGPVRVKAGGVRTPEDIARCKLFSGHDREAPVGYATELTEDGDLMRGTFKAASTEAGDLALLEASEKVRDAFSVELDEITFDQYDEDGWPVPDADGVLTVLDSFLRGVALVSVPAFDAARVAASRHNTPNGDSQMDPCEICGHVHDATVSCVDARAAANAGGTQDAGAAGDMVPPAAPAASDAGRAPAGLQSTHTRPRRPQDMFATRQDFMRGMAAFASGQRSAELTAALNDITQTAVGNDVQQPQWVGELWDGVEYERKIIPLFGSVKPLTSFKINGWKWTTKPAMATWSGDKTDVPSNAAATDPSPTTAERIAGAHDHDRSMVDFDNPEYWDSYYAAMAESYARLSDAEALSSALTFATDVATPDYEGFLGAIAAGVEAIDDATNASSTFVVVNKGDLIPWVLSLSGTTLAPRDLLELIGVDPTRVVTHSGMTAGHVLVGVSNAMDYYELSGSPIRVEAVDMVKGGIDTGLFGYHAEVLHDAEGLQDVVIDTGA